MHLRYRFAMSLVALSLAVAPAMAAQTKPAKNFHPISATAVSGTAACNAGQGVNGPADAVFQGQWYFPSDDYYYTFFDPATCCPGGAIDGGTIISHWVQYWPLAPCTITVQSWIVKAINNAGCYTPDSGNDPPDPTPAETLCGPSIIFPISGGNNDVTDHSIPLPPCACISQPAFILWKIVSNVNCPVVQGALDNPHILLEGSADPCVSYNGFLGGAPIDLVTDPQAQFPGNTMQYVETNCCAVKTLPSTWGKVKTLYR